jgi:fimbrial isopeptide formation D2 family protein/uncharacterized repeat protein (TIGR01451 family)
VSGDVSGTDIDLPIGSIVHDTATLSGATPNAGGTVTYSVYTDAACSSVFAAAGSAAVTNGVVGDSDSVTFNQAGTYYWQAVYGGDANNEPATSLCTSEVVTIVPNSVVINTELSGQGASGQHITIQVGNSVTDSATLTGETANAGGSVTYTVFSNSSCTTVHAAAGTVAVTNGVVPDSNPVTFNAPGTYYWQASYSGDANNVPAVSECTAETVAVIVPDTGIDKSHDDADGVVSTGQVVTYTILVEVVNGPVTNAVITDELPAGQTYVDGSETSSPAATFAVSPDGRTLTWTYASLANGDPAATLTYEVVIDEDAASGEQTNVAEICVSEVAECKSDDTTVRVPDLVIAKSFTGNTGGKAPDGTPEAKVGDVLTYTLKYTLTNGPVHNGVITDTLPVGLSYIPGSATNSVPGAEFTFGSYKSSSRTLTWKAPLVTVSGSVTYQVVVDVGADERPQPLVNVATIDSDETPKREDDKKVFVQPRPKQATGTPRITLPPTSTIDSVEQPMSNPGFGLMVILLALAGFVLSVGFITPAPERIRRRERRR